MHMLRKINRETWHEYPLTQTVIQMTVDGYHDTESWVQGRSPSVPLEYVPGASHGSTA